MRKHLALSLSAVLFITLSVSQETTQAQPADDWLFTRALIWFRPIPQAPRNLPNNPLTPEKVALGKLLFFEPRLSASQETSCNSCHTLASGGTSAQVVIGHLGQSGPRNVPTLLNAVFNTAYFWDGRADELAERDTGPIQAALAKRNAPERIIATLASMPDYAALFESAFPASDEPLSFDNVTLALEAFLATLITPNDRFDQYLRGDRAALDETELQGLELFISRGCASCHNGVNLGGRSYHPFGVVEVPSIPLRPAEDIGRAVITDTSAHNYVFRAPPLRNIELTPPYFHSGTMWNLKGATVIMGSLQLGARLSDEEAEAITAFMRALTGELPDIMPPSLPASTDTTPEPIDSP